MKYLTRIVFVLIGLTLLSFGVVLYLKAGLGVDAFTVFYGGIARTFHISIGRALQICLVILVTVVAFLDRTRLGIGTVMHALLVGVFIDLLLKLNFIPSPSSLALSAITLLAGIFCVGSGLAMYIKAGLGVGAIDALMLILYERTKRDIKWVRIGIDCTLATTGFLLGGPLGIGTVAGVLLTGPVTGTMMKFYSSLISKFASERRPS